MSFHTVTYMLEAVVVVEEAKAVNVLRKIAKTIIAKATEKEELAAAVANPSLNPSQA
jgi:hypothetical protein